MEGVHLFVVRNWVHYICGSGPDRNWDGFNHVSPFDRALLPDLLGRFGLSSVHFF